MSAICGIINFDGKPVEKSDLVTMAESSPFRGPDGTRFHLDGNAGFAHLAFHMTPESVNEKQPLVSDDGKLVLVADVRLDNREELAAKLGISLDQANVGASLAREFQTSNQGHREQGSLLQGDRGRGPLLHDSCLLLAAFLRWGEACVEHLLGDFVFAVWNRKSGELFLARDQLGGYGLSYHWMGQTLVFASETTAILDLPTVRPVINEDAVVKTLASMGLNADETYFKSIHYLPPAHYMRVSKSARRNRQYWDIDPDSRVTYRNEDEYTDHFLELLERAVACRLRSIHPVGISLSGGHDSTLLAAIAAGTQHDSGQVLQSFSNVFDHFTECDERRWICPVVERYGIDAHFVPSDELWSFSDWETRPFPKDFFWTNCFAQLPYAITQAARQAGCKVLIDGMLGDALFGEPSLFAADLLRSGRFSTLVALLYRYRDRMSWSQELGRHGVRQLLPRQLRRAYRRVRPAHKVDSIPGLAGGCADRLTRLRRKKEQDTESMILPPGFRMRYQRIFHTAWAQGFTATRGIPYNRNGIERVSPYFDRRLVEFVMAIPTEQLSHPGRPRKLQNDAMRRLLPREVWEREEKTHYLPLLHRGLSRKGREVLRQTGEVPQAPLQECVCRKWVLTQLSQNGSLAEHAHLLSIYLHLELWRRSIQGAFSGQQRWSEPCLLLSSPPSR